MAFVALVAFFAVWGLGRELPALDFVGVFGLLDEVARLDTLGGMTDVARPDKLRCTGF